MHVPCVPLLTAMPARPSVFNVCTSNGVRTCTYVCCVSHRPTMQVPCDVLVGITLLTAMPARPSVFNVCTSNAVRTSHVHMSVLV